MYSHSTPNGIVDLLERCKCISSEMIRHTKCGYVGQISIDSKPVQPRRNHEFIIQSLPCSYHEISHEEGLIWRARKKVPLLCSQINIQHLSRYYESVLFQIYKASGYGTLKIEFWCIEPHKNYKFVHHWFCSYREVALIELNPPSE